jgi:hypothetical protein
MEAAFYKYAKWCQDKGIKIYPVPISTAHTGRYYIVIERRNGARKGEKVFRDKATTTEPSVWYKMIYDKEFKEQKIV